MNWPRRKKPVPVRTEREVADLLRPHTGLVVASVRSLLQKDPAKHKATS